MFFEQSVLKVEIGHEFLQRQGFSPQGFDLARVGLTSGIASQPLLTHFKEFLGSRVIKALRRRRANDPPDRLLPLLRPLCGRDRLYCPRFEPREHDPDLFFRGMQLTHRPADVFYNLRR